MRHHLFTLLVGAVFLLFVAGCSANMQSPVTPTDETDFLTTLTGDTNPDETNRTFLGSWTFNFDTNTFVEQPESMRESKMHVDVTSFMTPQISVNSFDPVSYVVDVDFTLLNPTSIAGYDVRLVVFTDTAGHLMLNSDNWTGLNDIPGGLPINPFKAFAKSEPLRKFDGYAEHTENLLISLPGGNPYVTFYVDASWPSNCIEPYQMSNFSQDTIQDSTGSTGYVSVDILDWQDDIKSAGLYCPSLCGNVVIPFSQGTGDEWGTTITNDMGAGAGDYTGYLLTSSTGSDILLFDKIAVTVTHQSNIDPVGNVTLKVNRMSWNSYAINPGIPWTLSWGQVSGAAEYAIYVDSDPSDGLDNNLNFVSSTTALTYTVPPGHLSDPIGYVVGNTYVVRARENVGDPGSESLNSELAFIQTSSFDTLQIQKPLGALGYDGEGWTTAMERPVYPDVNAYYFWPHAHPGIRTSDPNALNLMIYYLGYDWDANTGQWWDDYLPGHIQGITVQTPVIENSTKREMEFCASCSNTWDCDEDGGIVMGYSNAPNQPMDGWDGTDFKWVRPNNTPGWQGYNWRYTPITDPFPFDMSDSSPTENNCWRWQSG